mgnify:CR=1 FL=1
MKNALVVRSTGMWYDLRLPDESLWRGRLRGKMRLDGMKVTNPVAVGDWVEVEVEDENEQTLRILRVQERENYIVRKSPRKRGHGHIIASNLDQVVVVVTMAYPRTSSGFIDRVTASAESFRIPVVVVFNKSDLLDSKTRVRQNDLRAIYQALGYVCLETSALNATGIDELNKVLARKKSLIIGHSGVGKSTLLNQIAPEIEQQTQEVSAFSEKGMHTTTFAEMFEVAPQTFLIDTPGIKEMGLLQIGADELAHYFPEMRERLGSCKFHNCTHRHEPKCGIREAVAAGQIAGERYQNYLRMLESEEGEP